MNPAPFDYVRQQSLENATAIFAFDEGAQIIAGLSEADDRPGMKFRWTESLREEARAVYRTDLCYMSDAPSAATICKGSQT